jgi:hypothetical protein
LCSGLSFRENHDPQRSNATPAPHKREVLFSGQNAIVEIPAKAIEDAPESLPAIEVVGAGLLALAPVFEDRHTLARRRQAVVAANPSLQQRELSKLASMVATVTDALRARGIPDIPPAHRRVGLAVFKVVERWIDSDGAGLAAIIGELPDELARTIVGNRADDA